jgi:hypothetical protein
VSNAELHHVDDLDRSGREEYDQRNVNVYRLLADHGSHKDDPLLRTLLARESQRSTCMRSQTWTHRVTF